MQENDAKYSALGDHELMMASKKGDLGAFAALVNRHKSWLVGMLSHYTRDIHIAEDLAQEAFVRVFRSLQTYTTAAKFTTWLYTIALNLAKTEYSRTRRKREMKQSELGPKGDDENDAFSSIPGKADRSLEPESRLVWECLDKLSEEERNLLVLRDIQGLSYEELAGLLECPIGTVKSRINRARFSFKDVFLKMNGTR